MRKAALLLACGLLAVSPISAGAKDSPAPAQATQNLPSLFSDEDYPPQAIRNNEQGPVGFRLSIDASGIPTACTVTSSSGSPTLDSTTCRLLMERARFTPARDAKGRPVPDEYNGRIVWRMTEDDSPPMPPIMDLWMICIAGESAKLVPGDLPAAEVAARAFAGCTGLEALVARDTNGSERLREGRDEAQGIVEKMIEDMRASLKSAPAQAPEA